MAREPHTTQQIPGGPRSGHVPCEPSRTDARVAVAAAWGLGLLLGGWQAWAYRNVVNPDSIAYLDIGDALVRGDWHGGVNALWSPLVPFLTGLALEVVQPSPEKQFAVAHSVQFALYLLSLLALRFFVGELLRYRAHAFPTVGATDALPVWAQHALGHAIFLWASFHLLGFARLSPDWGVVPVIFVACGLMLRILRDPRGWLRFVAAGFILGIGYLVKTPVLPFAILSCVFLALALGDARRTIPRTALALTVAAAVASPFVTTLSQARGRMTLGGSASLNYAWHVNHFGRWRNWQGEGDPRAGRPVHPTRQILQEPRVYEFSEPIGGTYPPWYDPAYWNEGLTPRFSARDQTEALVANGVSFFYASLFDPTFFGIGALVLTILLAAPRGRRRLLLGRNESLVLLLPSTLMVLAFLAVHIETRYAAPFMVVILVVVTTALRFPADGISPRHRAAVAVAAALVVVLGLSGVVVRSVWRAGRHFEWAGGGSHPAWEIASSLGRMGLHPGDRVGSIGSGAVASYWARLAGVRVVAELPPSVEGLWDTAWKAGPMTDPAVLDAFARVEVEVVVAALNAAEDSVPTWIEQSGWRRIGHTNHWAYFLDGRSRKGGRTVPGLPGASRTGTGIQRADRPRS